MNPPPLPPGGGSYLPRPTATSSLHHPRTVRYQLENDMMHKQTTSPSSITASIFRILSSLAIFFFIVLCAIGLVTTLFILYLTIRPFSLPTYRRLACNIGASAFIDAMALLIPNMRIYLTGDSDPLNPVGVNVLVCNHVMEGDWWAMLMLARCVGLRGSVKPFLQRKLNGNGATCSHSGIGLGPAHSNSGSPPNDTSGGIDASMHLSASAPLLNSTIHHQHHHHVGFKRNLSHQGVGGASTTNNSPRTTNTESNGGGNSSGGGPINKSTNAKPTSLIFSFLHNLLEFPLLSSEHTQNYIADRNELFMLLRSFASNGAPAPIHLLLFPEGWPEGNDRKSMIEKSIEFAKREGRPQLKHLLLPRTTGFYASLESLREASPVVYDITMAYRGYDGGESPFSCDISLGTIMKLIRGEINNEVHIRIKRYSMEEVLSDPQWLDKQWAEKDRLLGKFIRCGNFANVDNRGFCRYRVLDTRGYSVESSITALLRLGLIPFTIPVILILFVPLLWGVAWVWISHRTFLLFFPGGINEILGATNCDERQRMWTHQMKAEGSGNQDDISNGGTDSATGTPFCPATPFASPTHIASWRSAAPSSSTKDQDSPPTGRR